MRTLSKTSLFSAFAALLFLVGSAGSARAQSGLLTAGHGSYQAFSAPITLHFTHFVVGEPDGSARGFAIWRGPESTAVWQVTSAMRFEDIVLFAGPIVYVAGNPPPGQGVGIQAFTAFRDNGRGQADETSSLSVVPAMFGNPTIQEIFRLIGPPPAFRPLLTGNVTIL